jgi:hypothetical protein
MLYGVYCRKETNLQTKEIAIVQASSGEIWGTAARYGYTATVRGYAMPLQNGERGIDFTTEICPEPNQGPLHVNWYAGRTPGITMKTVDGVDYACLKANVTNKQL